jgi:tRNA threonylcarbamoyladenosine biosynthesis protein TsaB
MLHVAMDTAQAVGRVALLEDERLLGEVLLRERAGHVVYLPVALVRLLEQADRTASEVALLSVTLGPGSFSGVRIALGMAKGWALGRAVAVVGLSALEWMAASAGVDDGLVAVALDARRGEIFGTVYPFVAGRPGKPLLTPRAWTPDALGAALEQVDHPGSRWLTGSGVELYAHALTREATPPWQPVAQERWSGDGAILGRLGLARLQEQGPDDPMTLEPLYLRRSEAEENRAKSA